MRGGGRGRRRKRTEEEAGGYEGKGRCGEER